MDQDPIVIALVEERARIAKRTKERGRVGLRIVKDEQTHLLQDTLTFRIRKA